MLNAASLSQNRGQVFFLTIIAESASPSLAHAEPKKTLN